MGLYFGLFWPIWGPPTLARGSRRNPQRKSDAKNIHPPMITFCHYVEVYFPGGGFISGLSLAYLWAADVGQIGYISNANPTRGNIYALKKTFSPLGRRLFSRLGFYFWVNIQHRSDAEKNLL